MAAPRPGTPAPSLTLSAQTSTVTAAAPWFNLTLAIHTTNIPATELSVGETYYPRIVDESDFQQAAGGTPDRSPLLNLPPVPVTATAGTMSAATCVTVLPGENSTPPATGAGACAADDETDYLECTPDEGLCDGVYPVSIALYRQGASAPLERFTTFMTYEEPNDAMYGGPLRVSFLAPVSGTSAGTMTDALADHATVPTTLLVNPRTVAALSLHLHRGVSPVLSDLRDLTNVPDTDQLLAQPYVPIDVAALEQVGLAGEITNQVARGTQLLRAARLHPATGTWVDSTSNLTSGQGADLAPAVTAASASTLVLNDQDLAPDDSGSSIFAQTFDLDTGHSQHIRAAASNSTLDAYFTADHGDPVLAANQLLAGLSFVHLEDAYQPDPRGVVLVPPDGWTASGSFLDVLLAGLAHNGVLKPVTLSQLLATVPAGGNDQPSTRKLQSGAASTGSMTKRAVQRIALDRQNLGSFSGAVGGHPAVLTTLGDSLLASEDSSLTMDQRNADLDTYDQLFGHLLAFVSLAAQHTVTFTSRRAPIPITVLSNAPFRVTVQLVLSSDKFTFPHGNTRTLTLDRATTPVRVEAQARTSGDRLPVEVTLRTPDGLLVIDHATLSVHSTEISIVGIALTVLAGLVLLVWWGRTWRRARRQKPRAH